MVFSNPRPQCENAKIRRIVTGSPTSDNLSYVRFWVRNPAELAASPQIVPVRRHRDVPPVKKQGIPPTMNPPEPCLLWAPFELGIGA